MIENIFNLIYKLVFSSFIFSILGSFLWGIMSLILSPCHLSSIPLIIGYIIKTKKNKQINGLTISFIFSLGILISILLVGIISMLLGRIAGDLGIFNNILVTLIFLIMSLYFFNFLNFNFINLNFDNIFKKIENSYLVSFLIGIFLGTGIGPCTFAFFAPIFVLVFKNSTNIISSCLILISFGFGHILLIVLSGGFTEIISKYINFSSKNKSIEITRKIIGTIMSVLFLYYLIKTIKGVIQ